MSKTIVLSIFAAAIIAGGAVGLAVSHANKSVAQVTKPGSIVIPGAHSTVLQGTSNPQGAVLTASQLQNLPANTTITVK